MCSHLQHLLVAAENGTFARQAICHLGLSWNPGEGISDLFLSASHALQLCLVHDLHAIAVGAFIH